MRISDWSSDVCSSDLLGNGPKIALIHGIPTSRHLWRKIIPALVSAGREVIALDLLGYGESDKPLVADLGIQGQSDIVVQALLALGWARGTLVGHDIGGGIVQLIAVDHPEIIERLILVDSIVYDSFPEPGIARLKDPVWDGILEAPDFDRSEEHTSELQSLMRISYAVFCLKKKQEKNKTPTTR